jgi:hypothetical protein
MQAPRTDVHRTSFGIALSERVLRLLGIEQKIMPNMTPVPLGELRRDGNYEPGVASGSTSASSHPEERGAKRAATNEYIPDDDTPMYEVRPDWLRAHVEIDPSAATTKLTGHDLEIVQQLRALLRHHAHAPNRKSRSDSSSDSLGPTTSEEPAVPKVPAKAMPVPRKAMPTARPAGPASTVPPERQVQRAQHLAAMAEVEARTATYRARELRTKANILEARVANTANAIPKTPAKAMAPPAAKAKSGPAPGSPARRRCGVLPPLSKMRKDELLRVCAQYEIETTETDGLTVPQLRSLLYEKDAQIVAENRSPC